MEHILLEILMTAYWDVYEICPDEGCSLNTYSYNKFIAYINNVFIYCYIYNIYFFHYNYCRFLY